MAHRTWIRLTRGRLKRHRNRQRLKYCERPWRDRFIATRIVRQEENRRLRRVVREQIRGRTDALPQRMPTHKDEWMVH